VRASISVRAVNRESILLDTPSTATSHDFERAVSAGPKGAVALCAISVALLSGMWLAFYLLAFLPRGLLQ
jgi:hypothetical protein